MALIARTPAWTSTGRDTIWDVGPLPTRTR